jgi:hypothetical protein
LFAIFVVSCVLNSAYQTLLLEQTKKLLAMKDEEDRKSREEAMRADSQASKQQKIEESDFANAQDMFGDGSASGDAQGQGRFESWVLTGASKQVRVCYAQT